MDLYSTEHLKASSFLGTVEILGIQMMVLAAMLFLHLRGIHPRGMKLMEWIGVNSLSIFAFHRIWYIHMWIPVITYICAVNDAILPNTTPFLWFSIAVYLVFMWIMIKTKILRIIMKD